MNLPSSSLIRCCQRLQNTGEECVQWWIIRIIRDTGVNGVRSSSGKLRMVFLTRSFCQVLCTVCGWNACRETHAFLWWMNVAGRSCHVTVVGLLKVVTVLCAPFQCSRNANIGNEQMELVSIFPDSLPQSNTASCKGFYVDNQEKILAKDHCCFLISIIYSALRNWSAWECRKTG